MRILCLLGILLVGCAQTKHSATLFEYGEVYDTAYVPAGHGSEIVVNLVGDSITVEPVNVTIPERFAVIFKCQHGKFVIDGENGERMYKKLDRGDKVRISYREILKQQIVDTDNGKELRWVVVDLDFLDAEKVTEIPAENAE